MTRCVVSKEIVYTDAKAGEILALVRAGFNVEWLDGRAPSGRRAVRPAAQGESGQTIEKPKRFRKRRRRENLTPDQLKEMVALRAKGCHTRTLARKFRMSLSGVRNALYRHNHKNGGSE